MQDPIEKTTKELNVTIYQVKLDGMAAMNTKNKTITTQKDNQTVEMLKTRQNTYFSRQWPSLSTYDHNSYEEEARCNRML